MCRSVCAYMSPLFPVPSLSLAAQRQADVPHLKICCSSKRAQKDVQYIHDPYSIKHLSLEAGDAGLPQKDFQGMRKRGIKRELNSALKSKCW